MEFLWFLTQFRNDITEGLFQIVTLFGQQTLLIVLICIVFWCINKNLAFQMGFSFCLSGALVQGLKLVFRIPRPWILDAGFKPVESAVGAATGYSFPSGHTQSAASIYGMLGFKSSKNGIKGFCYFLVLLIGFSRLFLGVHTPKDVLCAIVISVFAILLVDRLTKVSEKKGRKVPVLLLFIICALAIGLYVYGFFLSKQGIVKVSYAYDCAQTTGATLGFVVGYLLEEKFICFEPRQKAAIQICKCVIGLLLLGLFKTMLKYLFGISMFWLGCQNFLLILFITVFYPLLFQKLLGREQKNA